MTHNASEFTVLVVDDEEALLNVTSRILQMEGYHVVESTNAAEALVLLTMGDGKVDLLLTDLHLGSMLGTDLAGWATEISPKLRVLFMSGDSRFTNKTPEALADIEGRCVDKPFTRLELTTAVQAALEGTTSA